MSHRPVRRVLASFSLGAILAATIATLTLGALVKQPCASGDWADGRQYKRLCYSDVVPLYGTEHLTGGRLPYLKQCPESTQVCDEYPLLTMYFMRTSAWIGHGYAAFFWTNALLLSMCAVVTAWALFRIAGERALYFALAPTLLIYGFVNWDLLAVALATGATLAFLRNRDPLAGVLVGLGAAAKAYPALLIVPFALERLRQRRRGGAAQIPAWATATYVVANLPFLLASFHPWSEFFRFNSQRPVDWDSLWFVLCQRVQGTQSCSWSVHAVNELSVVAFVALAILLYLLRLRRDPDFPRWTFGFPLIVAFLLTNKVYSPQYGLWLLPWFAAALPSPWLFGAFEVADVAVFLTRFTWFGRLQGEIGGGAFVGYRGSPLGAFELALVARAIVLVVCLAAWVRGPERQPMLRPVEPSVEPPARAGATL